MNQEPDHRQDTDIETAAAAEQRGADAQPGQQSSAAPAAKQAGASEAGDVEGTPGEAAATLEPDPTHLTMLLEDARSKADKAHDQLLRTRAEMENMSRRQAKELENAHKFALEGFIKELLQVRDSLELGHAAAQEPDADVAKLREGTELTLKLLGDVMGKFGVERIDPEGQPFNPEFHQAMSMQPCADLPPNTVTNVIQSGYLLNGRLVRPALVMVSAQA
ncbi:MAG: nucleotide exchange factor GrpE [Thiohalocapsa sp.]|jgi:molecular chaperone GrpE|uniref:nucleotide exchange factor GrpE n=1 Tax=Thiohalocapsa sp. TaxID=2497641 RepID=UPI0025EBBB2A|nr:nucleotide exchange factor GrpE [Thiohalocapsa sp.]MCG6942137.1 nucleotide exchange factor GrpE [Thiohalocapsa sp.]